MTGRTLVALSLFAGFYLFGAALSLALFWLPWAQLRYLGDLEPSGFLASVGGLYVLWALVPPFRRWSAPGLELRGDSQPRLHALVEEVARKTGHPMPHAVYLVEDAVAFASSRPRWYGLVREPVVAIGLPLFALLDRDRLAAVLAHEFGHHAGGDVKLGPWQHRTFVAIAAALDRLHGSDVLLHLPFYAYGCLYLRLTGAASRQQELRADALAARTIGARALGGALVALERYHSSWAAYWRELFVPAVSAGFRLPVLEGYQRFLAAVPVPALTTATPSRPPESHDTHPPLDERLSALGLVLERRDDEAHSISLLEELSALEERLLETLLTDPSVLPRLAPVSWDAWGHRVLPAIWKQRMAQRLEALRLVSLASLPALLADDAGWWERLRTGLNVYSPEARRSQLRGWVAHWAALSLLDAGFAVSSEPGAEVVLERDGVVIEPFRWVDDLASGARTAADWASLRLA